MRARARAFEQAGGGSGGGLIGRWRHGGGSGKRGHVRPLSNGRHPPSPFYPPPTLSLVIPPCHLPPPIPAGTRANPIPDRLASSHPLPFLSPFIPASPSRRTHRYHTDTITTTIANNPPLPLPLPPPSNPYTRRAKLWRVYTYVSLCTSTYMDVYTLGIRAALPYTAVSQNELDISRAREKSLNTRYTVYAITYAPAPPNFVGALFVRRHVTRRAPLSLRERRSAAPLRRRRPREFTSIFI